MSYQNDIKKDQSLGTSYKQNLEQLTEFQNKMKKMEIRNQHLQLQIDA